jgi:hypothetical protein
LYCPLVVIRYNGDYKAKTEVIGYRNSKNTKRGTTAAIEEGVRDVFKLTYGLLAAP